MLWIHCQDYFRGRVGAQRGENYGLNSYFLRSSSETRFKESNAVACRLILSISYHASQRDWIAHLGTTPAPNLSDATIASLHLSTHKHHLHPSFNPANPGRGVIRSFPIISYALTPAIQRAHTFLLGVLQELVGNDSSDEMTSRILGRSPTIPISKEPSWMRRVGRSGKGLKRFIENYSTISSTP